MISTKSYVLPLILAQSTSGLSSLRSGLGTAVLIIMMVAYVIGVVMLIGGAIAARRSGGEEGKQAIVWGIIIAAAGAIMNAAYVAFGLSAAVVNVNSSNF